MIYYLGQRKKVEVDPSLLLSLGRVSIDNSTNGIELLLHFSSSVASIDLSDWILVCIDILATYPACYLQA